MLAFLPNIGMPELIIILVALLLIFGASRLPEIGRSLGSGIKEFKKGVTDAGSDAGETKKISSEEEKNTSTPSQ